MISFLYIACIEILRMLGLILIGAAAIVVMLIGWPVQGITWMLDRVTDALRSAHDWLGN